MTDTTKLLQAVDNQLTALYKAYQDNKITLDELMSELSIIERISLTIQRVEKDINKSIKDGLELTDEFTVGQRKYYYKESTASVFDTKKAKSTLESLEYNLDDFSTLQFRKKLTYEL